MGGIGKTALALVLANKIKDRFTDGHLFIDLYGTSKSPMSPIEAMGQVIRAYRPTDKIPDDQNETRGIYLSVLSGKKTLLLLDNAASREQVEPLIPPEGCATLITSRNRFTLPGLKELDLDLLHPDKACELLLQISGRIGNRADKLADLCGYLPLALRNAAGALAERKDVSVADYEHRLSDKKARLELIEASFSLSYELLSPMRRKHWCRLSVFPEDFDLNGGAAVLKMNRDASAEALSDLVKWSLLDFIHISDSGEGRYKMHDLSRLYAESRLETADYHDSRKRHTKHYLNVLCDAENLFEKGGKNILAGLKLLDREWVNIREGQAWAEVMMQNLSKFKTQSDQKFVLQTANSYPNYGSRILQLRQHPSESIRWIKLALPAAKLMKDLQSESAHLARLGNAYSSLGDEQKAIEYHNQALAISRKIRNKKIEGAALGNLGLAYYHLGNVSEAIEYYNQALAISREMGDKKSEAVALGNLGLAFYSELGDAGKAIEYHDQALAISREIGYKENEGEALCNLGNAYSSLGEVRKAIEYHNQALAISREIGNKRGETSSLGNLGDAYSSLGEVRKAIEYYNQALAISREIGNKRGETSSLGNLGDAYSSLGEVRKAIEYYNQALAISREIEDKRYEGVDLGRLGDAYSSLGEVRKAIEYYNQALAISREIGAMSIEGEILCGLGKTYVALGETSEAFECFEQSLEIIRKIGDLKSESDTLFNTGKAYAEIDETNKAIDYYEQSLSIIRKIEHRRGEGDVLFNMSLALEKASKRPEALDLMKVALETLEQIESPYAENARKKLLEWQE
jgi:tetratricopeptide (TPR) repeat protein